MVTTLNIGQQDDAQGIGWENEQLTRLADNSIQVGAMFSVSPDTFTSGGTDDFGSHIVATLNDSGAAGGSDVFRLIKGSLTETDVTGWDNIYLVDLAVGGTSRFRVTNEGGVRINGPSSPSGNLFEVDIDDIEFWSIDANGILTFDSADDKECIDIKRNGNSSIKLRTDALGGVLKLKNGSGGDGIIISEHSRLIQFQTNVSYAINMSSGTLNINHGGIQRISINSIGLSFFAVAEVAQQTTGVTEAVFVENSGGTAVNVDSTFGGYTIQQIVQAMQNYGLLA
jgi:hypothetical protein